MLKFLIVGLPAYTTDDELLELVAQYGKIRKFHHVKDMFSSQSKGIAFFEMEGHEAKPAMAAINGMLFNGKTIYTRLSDSKSHHRK